MKAEIISTGTELLLGQTLNTSAFYLTEQLSSLGIEVDYHTTVGDNPERLKNVIRQAIERSDLIITTGGTGPTKDDLAKELVAQILNLDLVLDRNSLEAIKAFFAGRNAEMPRSNEKQAYIPQGAKILPNPAGTAPGAIVTNQNKKIVILPGPPSELEPMFTNYLLPELKSLTQKDSHRMQVRVLKLFGLDESAVEEIIGDLMLQSSPAITLLAKRGELHIRLIVRNVDQTNAERILDQTEREIRTRLGDKVFGKDKETLVGIVSQELKKANLSLAVAESCTGGMLGAALTQESGSSEFFLGGVISYSNSLKVGILGINQCTLDSVGAVSQETAREMAEGVRKLTGAKIGMSITGIAGPTGGSHEKPVGLVYIGLAAHEGVEARRFQFFGGRDSVRQLSVNAALQWLRCYLLRSKGEHNNS
ncbi:MAG: competence/damage-inducible protein A [Desulfitobacterium hafniense]|nr:competence/damage-inducible protein A [Desulfitobacterium hafniense]